MQMFFDVINASDWLVLFVGIIFKQMFSHILLLTIHASLLGKRLRDILPINLLSLNLHTFWAIKIQAVLSLGFINLLIELYLSVFRLICVYLNKEILLLHIVPNNENVMYVTR